MPADTTPMMRQYLEMKQLHPDCLLFFRLGDFYEMFRDDAKLASKELELALTTRDRGKPKEEQTPMCGVPYHSAEAYISRLIAKGYKVAICEQMEDPAQAKGLVERDVTRIISPGTVIDESMLEEGRNNFLCAICREGEEYALALCDLSTGEFSASSCRGEEACQHLYNELGAYAPREAVLSPDVFEEQPIRDFLEQRLNCRCENGGEERFSPQASRETLERNLKEIPPRTTPACRAAGGLLSYLYETQKADLSHITALSLPGETKDAMELDLTARRTLELTETLRGKEKKGSLLWVLDRTGTPMGRRLIRTWVERPLLNPAAINRRLEAVRALTEDSITRDELSLVLRDVTDLERLMGRIVYGTAGSRELVSLAAGLAQLPHLKSLLKETSPALLLSLRQDLDEQEELRALIGSAIQDEPPLSVREGGFIRKGYHPEVDRLRDIMDNGKAMVAAIEAGEKERTGIKSLKVRYNKVFGYYIEVSRTNLGQVPDHYIRKQTLVNCERFITQELKDLEHDILSAQDRITALEYDLFCQLRQKAAQQVRPIQQAARAVAVLDVLVSFARVAVENHYCMPQVDLSDKLEITEGRHPVVEKMLKDSLFVPNDAHLDNGEDLVSIITGPNMAGKSTYMRQVALIALMAQMGSFVPAKTAHIGVLDRVFTRIGASDDLSAGQSTFMVEMTEVSALLKNATPRSLLILDEIGRGTSTYDGMAIARAVLEYVADRGRLGAKTLFATHYHELTDLEGKIPGVKNYNIAAKKRQNDVIFLRKIVRGGAQSSYGIEVAGLAGLPPRVISRARAILEELEREKAPRAQDREPGARDEAQLSMQDMGAQEVARRLREVDLNILTPIEAMNLIFQLKQEL